MQALVKGGLSSNTPCKPPQLEGENPGGVWDITLDRNGTKLPSSGKIPEFGIKHPTAMG
jgi:hypothetical protein